MVFTTRCLTGNKLPLTCVFAAVAIVFIHGLTLNVAPREPELREPEARAWAAAEDEAPRPKAGVVFMSYADPRTDGHGSGPTEVVHAGRLLKKIMRPAYPTLLFANKATLAHRHDHGVFDDVRELNLNSSLYTTEHAGAVQALLSAASDPRCGRAGTRNRRHRRARRPRARHRAPRARLKLRDAGVSSPPSGGAANILERRRANGPEARLRHREKGRPGGVLTGVDDGLVPSPARHAAHGRILLSPGGAVQGPDERRLDDLVVAREGRPRKIKAPAVRVPRGPRT